MGRRRETSISDIWNINTTCDENEPRKSQYVLRTVYKLNFCGEIFHPGNRSTDDVDSNTTGIRCCRFKN